MCRAGAGQQVQRQKIIYHQQYKFKQPQHYDDCRDYRRLLVQLEETERRFDEFWRTHRNRLEQCLRLRMFEQDFRELQVSCTFRYIITIFLLYTYYIYRIYLMDI